uniref:CBS domain-containing protein n=1 Tax=Marseillevirus LCMAC201 TaxID=2506605 RepID=A0A481YW95_9VIRU|nr:MAG: uncharacterized protein LCMAC201_04440 [Marseillevirus LCMAC201]
MNPKNISLFTNAAKKNIAYTFSDITLRDIPSNVLPSEVDTTCNVTTNYTLKKPLISAAMDTVTEAEMAVIMAKNGGLGVIHRNLSIDDQVSQIEWVRRQVHYGGKITRPTTFNQNNTVAELQRESIENGWNYTSFPILDDDECLVGMVTKDELEFVNNGNPQLHSIMKPLDKLFISDDSTDIEKAYQIMSTKKIKKLPLCDATGHLNGMYVWGDVRKNQETRSQFSLDHSGRLLVAAAVGPSPVERERISKLINIGCPILVVDCSHGACLEVTKQIKYIRQIAPKVDIIAGNIASYDSAIYLLTNAPPDALKVGIGPGSICTTRRVTGHGVPQLTATFEVYKALLNYPDIPIIVDGGITSSGDIVKSFIVGADCVMLGSMLAGTDEAPGEVIIQGNKKYKSYRGMGSRSAMAERSGSRARYFKGDTGTELVTIQQQSKITPEGIEGFVEYRGAVASILDDICGGIQSGMAHSNAKTIPKLREHADIWIQTVAGHIEGNTHNVIERV